MARFHLRGESVSEIDEGFAGRAGSSTARDVQFSTETSLTNKPSQTNCNISVGLRVDERKLRNQPNAEIYVVVILGPCQSLLLQTHNMGIISAIL
jgi:hypothetical protein